MKNKPIRIHRSNRYEKLPFNTKLVSRPSRYGNPYKIGEDYNRQQVLVLFMKYLVDKLEMNPGWLEPLRGWNLACSCKPDQSCHADILLIMANAEDDTK